MRLPRESGVGSGKSAARRGARAPKMGRRRALARRRREMDDGRWGAGEDEDEDEDEDEARGMGLFHARSGGSCKGGVSFVGSRGGFGG